MVLCIDYSKSIRSDRSRAPLLATRAVSYWWTRKEEVFARMMAYLKARVHLAQSRTANDRYHHDPASGRKTPAIRVPISGQDQ